MTDAVIEVKVRLPGPDEPGFLRRQRGLMIAMDRMGQAQASKKAPAMLEALDDLADTVAQYLEAPEGAEPRELAYELSSDQFHEILGALAGKAESPPKKRSSS